MNNVRKPIKTLSERSPVYLRLPERNCTLWETNIFGGIFYFGITRVWLCSCKRKGSEWKSAD